MAFKITDEMRTALRETSFELLDEDGAQKNGDSGFQIYDGGPWRLRKLRNGVVEWEVACGPYLPVPENSRTFPILKMGRATE
jgi:hypothetical protein